jgi:hypothetical protein
MSLNQKYTWADFLKANPSAKTQKLKRTSDEGQKAFEAAYKKYIKDYLKDLMAHQEKALKDIIAKRDVLVKKLKATKKPAKAKIVQAKVGKRDHAAYRTQKSIERTKSQQKHF